MAAGADQVDRARPIPIPLWMLGLILLAAGLFVCGSLSASSLEIFKVPGCSAGGGCAGAAESKFGSIPFTNDADARLWPVSFMGLGFVLAMTAAWIAAFVKKTNSIGLFWIATSGAFISTMYLGIIVANLDQYFCPWCLSAHVANLLFYAVVIVSGHVSKPRLEGSMNAIITAGLTFVLATGALAGVRMGTDSAVSERREREAQEALDTILDNDQTEQDEASDVGADPLAEFANPVPADDQQDQPDETDNDGQFRPEEPQSFHPSSGFTLIRAQASDPQASDPQARVRELLDNQPPINEEGFSGRYIIGPDKAEVRIVTVSSYQCPACIEKEAELERLLDEYPGRVNLSVIHYPLNSDCNEHVERTQHQNGCWAARAAEAAGIIGGDEAFAIMHKHLYDLRGTFDNVAPLRPALQRAGIDERDFLSIMTNEETLKRLESDIDYAHDGLGVFQTPTIYVNGVEFRAWPGHDAVYSFAKNILDNQSLEPKASDADEPIGGFEKLVQDFFRSPHYRYDRGLVLAQNRPNPPAVGPADAPLKLTIVGSFMRENFIQLQNDIDQAIENLPDGVGPVRIEYRHFPYDPACDSTLQGQIDQALARNPGDRERIEGLIARGGCAVQRTAEVVHQHAGQRGLVEFRDWAMDQGGDTTEEQAYAVAADILEIDPQQVRELASDAEINRVLEADMHQTRRLNNGIFVFYVNGRYVPPSSFYKRPDVIQEILVRMAEREDN